MDASLSHKEHKRRYAQTEEYQHRQRTRELQWLMLFFLVLFSTPPVEKYLNSVDIVAWYYRDLENPFEDVEGAIFKVTLDSTIPLIPEIFVNNLDVSGDYLITFVSVFPFTAELGIYEVPIKLTDLHGHEAEVLATLSVGRESYLPLIEGVADITVFRGDTVSYRGNVTASDRYGRDLEVKVDNSQVNLHEVGEYPVFYSVMDEFGIKSEVSCVLQVLDDRSEMQVYVENYVAGVLADITHTGMSDYQKAEAIFYWCKNNVRYASSGPHDEDVYALAYASFRGGAGDCFTYYAVAYVLLLQAGIPVIPMERVDGTFTTHRWVAVNVGEGWYHFDTSKSWTNEDIFMYSDSEARALTAASDEMAGYATRYLDYKTPLRDGVVIEEY